MHSTRSLSLLPVLVLAAVVAPACKDVRAAAASQDVLECQAKALRPLLGPAYDGVETAKAIAEGKATLTGVLAEAGADVSEVKAVANAFHACAASAAQADAGAPDAGDAGQ